MKVKELIAELLKLDPEALCVYAKDDEGNGFQEVFYVPSSGLYDEKEQTFMTTQGIIEEIANDKDFEFDGKNAVCIN